MFRTRFPVYAALAALITLPLASCDLGAKKAAAEDEVLPRAVRVITAEKVDADFESTGFSGVVKAKGQVEIGFQVGGLVTDVYVDVGDKVRKGQVLARLDTTLYAAQRDQAAGALGQAQAQLSLYEEGTRKQEIAMAESQVRSAEAVKQRVETDYHRAQELYEKGVFARQKLDEAQSAYVQACEALRAAQEQLDIANEGARPQEIDAAKAAVLQARGAYSGANRQLQYAALTAPSAGTIVWREIEPGMTIGGDPVFEIADMSELEVHAEVPESRLSEVELGKVAIVEFPALPGQQFEATVTNIAPEAQSATRGFPVKLALVGPSEQIVPGLVAVVRLHDGEGLGGIRIERRSIVNGQVFVVEGDVAHARPVEVIADAGEWVVVTGLEEGAQVVINGQQYVNDGEQVNIVSALAIDEITKLDGKSAQ